MAEYGRIRERMILSPWACLSEKDFVRAVTFDGCPFHGALMNGSDLYVHQTEVACWRLQTLMGLDFDKCPVSGREMVAHLKKVGLEPWLAYYTFSHRPENPLQSYRVLWRVESDLNLEYSQVSSALKVLNKLSMSLGDKHAMNPTRLWQGTNSGFFHWNPRATRINVSRLLAEGSPQPVPGATSRPTKPAL